MSTGLNAGMRLTGNRSRSIGIYRSQADWTDFVGRGCLPAVRDSIGIRLVLVAISFGMVASLVVEVGISSSMQPFGLRAPPDAFGLLCAQAMGQTSPPTTWRFGTCQPGVASNLAARNAPISPSAWSAAASLPTPDTKPCAIPCQTSSRASTPASTARST